MIAYEVPPAPAGLIYIVQRNVDGDTIRVLRKGKEITVRIIGIDTPETHRPNVPVQCGGPEASANMAKLAKPGSKVRIVPDETQDSTDKYGRTLAYVENLRHRDFGLAQVKAGWATVYVYRRKFQRTDAYRKAQTAAQKAKRGVYKLCGGDFHKNP